MPKTTVAAIDLGATSGRVIVGQVTREGVDLTEAYRFPNAFRELHGHYYWDVGGLFSEICTGLHEAKRLYPELRSCGVDTWGVDYVLTNQAGRLVFPPHSYRDERTRDIMARIMKQGDDRMLFNKTGLPMVNYNTGLQLAETLEAFPGIRKVADKVMLLPEYFNFLLCGVSGCEFSEASTTQMLDVTGMDWSRDALDYFNIPHEWLPSPRKAGSLLGKVTVSKALSDLDLALVPGHDTSCAFEAIPRSGNSLIISSGTWMLAGAFTDGPCLGDAAFSMGISNERTGTGEFRPTKILMGLWLLEQTIPFFDKRPTSDAEWSALISAAEEVPMPDVLIDTSDEALFNPSNMRQAIDAQIKTNGGTPPSDLPGYVKLICASLGASTRKTADAFESILGKPFDNIVIVGGGSKNSLLCQMLANFTDHEVTSYSLEATSVGNMAYQLLALGKISSLSEFHELLRPSLSAKTYQPE